MSMNYINSDVTKNGSKIRQGNFLRYTIWTVILVVGFVAILLVTKVFSGNQKEATRDEIESYLEELVKEVEKKPFTFVFVPNALEAIQLPAPTETNELDQEAYDRLVTEVDQNITEEEILNDIGFNLPYGDTTYGKYINENSELDLFQVYDELAQITLHFNEQYQRPSLKDRIEGVIQRASLMPAVYEAGVVSVYPSWHAVEAYMVAEVLTRLDEDNAQVYRNNSETLVDRGIGYGLYGKSDAEAARSIVQQYFNLIDNPVETNSDLIDESIEANI